MTPQEKAIELVDKFRKEFDWVERDFPIDLYRDTRQCALICVDEILNTCVESMIYYWQEVKTEIEKL